MRHQIPLAPTSGGPAAALIVKTSSGHVVKVAGKSPDRPLAIQDSGVDGPYRYRVPGFRLIKSRQQFSKAFLWSSCASYEIMEDHR